MCFKSETERLHDLIFCTGYLYPKALDHGALMMSTKIVNIEALNLRSAPIVDQSNRLGILHLGQTVTVLNENQNSEWIQAATQLNKVKVTGYIKRIINGVFSLREPVSPQREALIANAVRQWIRFDQGQGLEYIHPYSGYIGEMWKSIKMKLDGNDRDMPWSAAFISFVVRKTSAEMASYSNFNFAPSHSKYLHDSIIKRKDGDSSVPFWGYRLSEQMPQPGDIIARWRETERKYDDAAHDHSFKSHCDIIASVNADFVLAIGGNVNQSVNITRYEKSGGGYLLPSKQVFMLMVNNV